LVTHVRVGLAATSASQTRAITPHASDAAPPASSKYRVEVANVPHSHAQAPSLSRVQLSK